MSIAPKNTTSIPLEGSSNFPSHELDISLHFAAFLQEYAGVPQEDLVQHILQVVRKKIPWFALVQTHTNQDALQREAFPDTFGNLSVDCFRLLNYSIRQHPRYSYLLGQLRTVSDFNPPAILIVGTTFGQDLRYLLQDGIPTSKLYAYFLRPGLFDASTALFRDADRFPPMHSIRADTRAGETTSPLYLSAGFWTAINTNGYLNRFDLNMQEQVAYTMLSFLKKEEGSILLGSVLGNETENMPSSANIFTPEDTPMIPNTSLPVDIPGTPYRHTSASLRAMWERVHQQSGLDLFIEIEVAPNEGFSSLANGFAHRLFFFIEIQRHHEQSEWRVFG